MKITRSGDKVFYFVLSTETIMRQLRYLMKYRDVHLLSVSVLKKPSHCRAVMWYTMLEEVGTTKLTIWNNLFLDTLFVHFVYLFTTVTCSLLVWLIRWTQVCFVVALSIAYLNISTHFYWSYFDLLGLTKTSEGLMLF